MNYLLGTGYYPHPHAIEERFRWEQNVAFTAKPEPSRIVTISVGQNEPPLIGEDPVNWVALPNNLGHVGDLLNGSKPHEFCGWSAAVLALAMIAYAGELDFVYLEEDALAFGPWVERMYAELGDGQFAFGRKMESPPYMACSQSLFIVKHAFIPRFVSTYLSLGRDGDPENLPETKFHRIEERFPAECRRLSFTVDRERPLPYDAEVWSAQKFSPDELEELRKRGMI